MSIAKIRDSYSSTCLPEQITEFAWSNVLQPRIWYLNLAIKWLTVALGALSSVTRKPDKTLAFPCPSILGFAYTNAPFLPWRVIRHNHSSLGRLPSKYALVSFQHFLLPRTLYSLVNSSVGLILIRTLCRQYLPVVTFINWSF